MSFIKVFTFSTIILLGTFAGLITAIDPYDKLGNNLFGFETKAVAQSRENKFYMYEASTKPYTAFILGSSAAHRYPTQKLDELTGLLSFNYAVQHSTPIDYLAIIKHILSKNSPKLILIQLDFAALDNSYKVDNRLFNSPLKKYLKEDTNRTKPLFDNSNFTLEALRDSFRVIFVNLFGEARHIYLEDGNYIKEKINKGPVKTRQSGHSKYSFSTERMQVLKNIKELCERNQIKLIVLTAPIAIKHLEKIWKSKKTKKMHQKYKNELRSLFPNFFDFSNESMRKYNSSRYFHDSVHPTKDMSEIILESIFK